MVWECGNVIRREWEDFSKHVRYEVGDGSKCGFGMMFGVGSNL
jgi:DNA-directed RNA polymerase subunit N (RpoN/RPB10)